MNSSGALGVVSLAALLIASSAFAADRVSGQVLGGGDPIANSSVVLWAAGSNAPVKLAETKTNNQGQFDLRSTAKRGADSILYLVATGGVAKTQKGSGDNPAIVLLAVLGNKPPEKVTINEFTTVASVWTNTQFLSDTRLQGHALGLRIAAGNVPNFVDLSTGKFGGAILEPFNSTQTTTMANFATLATLMAGCITRARADACSSLFSATTPPDGKTPTDTLLAAEAIAHNSAYKPERLFALLDSFYPVPPGKKLRATPFMPYLSLTPSAWVLPLKFTGGGVNGPGKIMFDSEGNAWTGANFIVGSQGRDALWDGNLAEFAPNGTAISPAPTGFFGGGLEGPGFGTTIDAQDNVWLTSTAGKTISEFDKTGKPVSPAEGYNFGGQLGLMQGIIATPNGDIWALDFGKDTVVYLPKGEASKGKVFCQSTDGKPNKQSPCKLSGPFHLAIDQQDRIWITNAIGDTVTRFPASDPSKVEVLPAGGHSGKGMAIDSKGNAWIANTLGDGLNLWTKLHLLYLKLDEKMSEADPVVLGYVEEHPGLGSISMLRPDGTSGPGSPFNGGGSTWGTWAIAIDGNDQVWASNFMGRSITHLCGIRTETCPPGMKTGDPISPPGGYVGGNMEMLTDIAIDPAGDVWVANNWQNPSSCYGNGGEAKSTLCGGNGLTIFYGMAKPVRVPLIGPPRQP